MKDRSARGGKHMSAEAAVSFSPQDLFNFPDPYPIFAMLRQNSPVLRVDQAQHQTYLVTRYDDVATILRDGETFSSRINADGVGPVMGRTIIEMDGKEHQKHRQIIQYAFHFK